MGVGMTRVPAKWECGSVGVWDPARNCRCCNNTDRVKARKGFLLLNTRLTWQTCEVQLAVFQAPTQSDMAATAESSVALSLNR